MKLYLVVVVYIVNYLVRFHRLRLLHLRPSYAPGPTSRTSEQDDKTKGDTNFKKNQFFLVRPRGVLDVYLQFKRTRCPGRQTRGVSRPKQSKKVVTRLTGCKLWGGFQAESGWTRRQPSSPSRGPLLTSKVDQGGGWTWGRVLYGRG